MNLYKKWIQHLQENNMSYTEHFIFAIFYGSICLLAGCCLIIHSILPCFFPTAGRNLVSKLSKIFNN